MVRTELVKRSPLRLMEKSMHGGVGKGNIGILVSKKGIGKTACLVHIATDKLLQDKHVIHVSYSSRTDHIISWYEDIFKEIARKRNLESAMTVHDEIIKKRVIMNFSQEGTKTEQVLTSLRSMIRDGNFKAEAIVIDGFDFKKGGNDDLEQIKAFAVELDLEIWISTSMEQEELKTDKNGVPKGMQPYIDNFCILVNLVPEREFIRLQLVKDHGTIPNEDLHIKLDPKTLLIAE
ncbi:MAG: hypothetical protein K9L68_02050 [Spirochaetales bacterium]|nr:hypothetical protein [Spirochaetales bacterium]MCF7937361.1 hypothetical protein [Spirochaetales bacterium]